MYYSFLQFQWFSRDQGYPIKRCIRTHPPKISESLPGAIYPTKTSVFFTLGILSGFSDIKDTALIKVSEGPTEKIRNPSGAIYPTTNIVSFTLAFSVVLAKSRIPNQNCIRTHPPKKNGNLPGAIFPTNFPTKAGVFFPLAVSSGFNHIKDTPLKLYQKTPPQEKRKSAGWHLPH